MVPITVRSKVSLATTWPLSTLMVMVVVPPWLAAGVTVTDRLEPLPPNTMFVVPTSVGFEEVADKLRLPTGTAGSPIVKAIGLVELLVVTVRSGMAEMVDPEKLLIH